MDKEAEALEFMKKTRGLDRLDVDCIGRVEVWTKQLDIDSGLNWLLEDEKRHHLESGLPYEKRFGKENREVREQAAWHAVLEACKKGNVYIVSKGRTYILTTLLEKGTSVESLLIEKDLLAENPRLAER